MQVQVVHAGPLSLALLVRACLLSEAERKDIKAWDPGPTLEGVASPQLVRACVCACWRACALACV